MGPVIPTHWLMPMPPIWAPPLVDEDHDRAHAHLLQAGYEGIDSVRLVLELQAGDASRAHDERRAFQGQTNEGHFGSVEGLDGVWRE